MRSQQSLSVSHTVAVHDVRHPDVAPESTTVWPSSMIAVLGRSAAAGYMQRLLVALQPSCMAISSKFIFFNCFQFPTFTLAVSLTHRHAPPHRGPTFAHTLSTPMASPLLVDSILRAIGRTPVVRLNRITPRCSASVLVKLEVRSANMSQPHDALLFSSHWLSACACQHAMIKAVPCSRIISLHAYCAYRMYMSMQRSRLFTVCHESLSACGSFHCMRVFTASCSHCNMDDCILHHAHAAANSQQQGCCMFTCIAACGSLHCMNMHIHARVATCSIT